MTILLCVRKFPSVHCTKKSKLIFPSFSCLGRFVFIYVYRMKNWLDNLLSWATEVVERSVNLDLISYRVSLQCRCFHQARECFTCKSTCWNSKKGEKIGRVERSGVGGGKREETTIFLPSPSAFPSFALAPTLRVTIFTLPNLPPL